MLNYIWGIMIIAGITLGLLLGDPAAISNAPIDSAKEAVTLCITMLGVMSFWMGLMQVAKASGIIKNLTRLFHPIIRFLFPHIPEGHIANEYIASNMISNILGLGWAATPVGLKAMKELAQIEKERHPDRKNNIASTEMCTFLIINISSLQLIPVNIIAYRSQYGSTNPTAIVAPAIVATMISTLVGIIFSKIMEKIMEKKNKL